MLEHVWSCETSTNAASEAKDWPKETSGPQLSTTTVSGYVGSIVRSTDVAGKTKELPKEKPQPQLSTTMRQAEQLRHKSTGIIA